VRFVRQPDDAAPNVRDGITLADVRSDRYEIARESDGAWCTGVASILVFGGGHHCHGACK